MSNEARQNFKDRFKQRERLNVDPMGDLKIAESRGLLEQFKSQTSETINKIRSNTDANEDQRRIQEEKMRKDRANAIQTEVITSHKKNVEIDWTWQELEEKEDCEELAQDIENQKLACKQIIEQKDQLIKMFMDQLKSKDEEYVKSLKKQNDDIDDLIKTMKDQFKHMRGDYTNQLANIEKAFMEERMAILKRNDDEIKHLFDEHRKLEDQFLKMRAEEDEKYSKSLEDLRTKDANDQATLKIELEKEMQILEKCMEDMKAVYRLNEEKLDFNHRVLNDRKDVMQKQVDSYKIKERNMKGKLGTIIEKFKDQSTDNQKKNIDLTIQYKKFTKLYKELQDKFKRFEKSDENRFNEVWTMNEHEVRAMINKIIQADRVIHVQQLGIPWTPPTDPIFGFADTLGNAGQAEVQEQNSQIESQNQNQSRSHFEDDQSATTGNYDNKEQFARFKAVFKLLIEETPFLIDDKAEQQKVGKSAKEQFAISIDSIRKGLGIDSMEDVEMLVNTFFEYSEEQKRIEEEEEAQNDDEVASKISQNNNKGKAKDNGLESEEEEDEEEDENKLRISHADVVKCLVRFHQKREEKLKNQETLGNPRTKKKSNFETESVKKERIKREERIFWEKMTTVLSEQKLSIWHALDKASSKYYTLLVDRQNLIEETGLLNQQNEELKTLLNQYLQAGVNHELHVPPTQVIRLDI